ncbi:MAG: Peptidase S8 [Nitrosopumilales archaeon]|nr:MAG: Peptidase S8 [Nitrosopumilales archaeon]
MPQAALFLLIILLGSLFFNNSYSFLGGDLPQQYQQNSQLKLEHTSGIVKINSIPIEKQDQLKRYLIFGSGTSFDANSEIKNQIHTIESQTGFFSVGVISENKISKLQSQGFYVIEDFLVDLHSSDNSNDIAEISRIGAITGSEMVHQNYNLTGTGIKIAVIDTGVDFSNLDIRHSLARDKDNIPIMLDADGQGIILTNATFVANIDENGIIRNFTQSLPEDVTSKVYRTKKGVFLDLYQNGNGTILQIYNSFYPQAGFAPIFNGTLTDDMKIGTNNRDYIVSKSGIYHLGIMYQGALQGPFGQVQVVPVLVVDSVESGVYDTIIPDMSTSWEDYTRFDLPSGEKPNYDFDFTDETPIKLGSGNEFLIYDFDDDGKFDYSAGTIGAQVLDIYGVVQNKTSTIDPTLKAINGTLLPPMDPNGEFFGVMTDFVGHGTSSAASIISKGSQEYDIYNNTKKYTIRGVAPGAQIIPVKALWFGDIVYAWLWSSGFENNQNEWKFIGKSRADIISNSWGVSNFPSLGVAPGMDILSLILNMLVTPQSLDFHYPGVLMVTSAGNSGHGYGTLGLPTASTLAISVGATTNNVFVGYGSFKDQPRFGNTTEHSNNVVDFSSRGPGYIGDPKPDLMSIGAYSFTPSQVTKLEKDSTKDPFSLFGGTSMAAPLVSGSAALVMESLNKKFEEHDPLEIKNILMSTATDLYNDPFTQGAGLVNVFDAIKFVEQENGMFIVYNDATYSNIKDILDSSVERVNSTVFGIEQFQLPDKKIFLTSWFGGQLFPDDRSSATFTIENPSDEFIEISIKPQTIELIQKTQLQGTTEPQIQDPILNETGTFAPNYIRLSDVKEHETLASLYDESNPIPSEATLMVLNVNFPFETFMNKTDDIYANDLKISSLYLYDWNDKNDDNDVSSDELSMINRGGSWGTVQEIRITLPNEKFEHTPLVGIYPVPTRYSYWIGDTQQNSTSIDYTLSSSYYKKTKWDVIWTSSDSVTVPPKSSSEVTVTIIAPINSQTGVYQGFLTFEGDKHTANVPVSYVVKTKIEEKDSVVLIPGQSSDDVLYGHGYVKGAFDMVNRYMAGDWRQYYFDIEDPTINTAAIDISWESDDTNLSVFVIDPQGRIAQTNMPSGVFGQFLGWPSLDWLGTSPFSQGGGFFPVKNKDGNSTVLYVPINQTGTYGMLLHTTLFGGNSTTEPISIAAKFTTISHEQIPEIIEAPNFVHEETVTGQVEDEKLKDSSIDKETIDEQKISDQSFNIFIGILIGIVIGVAALIPLVIRKKKTLTKQ